MRKRLIYIALASVAAQFACAAENAAKWDVEKFKDVVVNNSMFWCKLGWPCDPPAALKSGKAAMITQTDAKTENYVKLMSNAGVKIMTTNISTGWLGNDLFDYTETDKSLEAIFKNAPNAYYMPRVKLNVPPTWCAKNPEEATVFYPFKLTNAEITDLYNRGEFDFHGVRPKFKVGLQSFASKKWVADASIALRKFIEHVEKSKYADRIIGYHIAFGVAGECANWRGWEEDRTRYNMGDNGKAFSRRFYDWGLEKYGSHEVLTKAWNQPNLSRENVEMPSTERRESLWQNTADFFRDSPDAQLCMDIEDFFSHCTATALDSFGKVAKDASGGKAVGAFYGYYMNVPRSGYLGHLAYNQLLASENIDFICAPKAYERNLAGDPGGYQNAAMSISRKKLYIDELDNPPHTYKKGDMSNLSSDSMSQTRTVMWREVAKDLSIGAGFWWMDLKGDWYTTPDVLAEVTKIEKEIAPIRADKSGKRSAQILYVTDERAFLAMRPNARLHDDLLRQTYPDINLVGAQVEHYRLSDLKDVDLSNYKVVFFANPVAMTPKMWRKIEKRLPEGAAVVWNYAAGVRPPNGFDMENSRKLTGVKMTPVEDVPEKFSIVGVGDFEGTINATRNFAEGIGATAKKRGYPVFKIEEGKGVKVLAKYADGLDGVALVSKKIGDKTHYICGVPFLTPEKLRKIAESAKVDFVAPEYCTVYGDSRYVGIFPKYAVQFKLNLKGEYRDAISGKTYKEGDEISIPEKGAVFLIRHVKALP